MKKVLFLFIIAVFFINKGFSQGKVSGGIVFSPVVSWVTPDTKSAEMDKIKFGFNFGLVGDYNISENFAFAAGLLVNKYGGSVQYIDSIPKFESSDVLAEDESLEPDAIIDYKLTYIEIPLGLKGKTKEIGYITYFMKAGINPALRYKAKADINQNGLTDVDASSVTNLFQMGFHIGGGIEYSLGGSTKILAEIDYLGGLTDIAKTEMYIQDAARNELEVLSNVALRLGILF
jgi:hypothetical protein